MTSALTAVCGAALLIAATGCAPAGNLTDPNRNADAKEFTFTIAGNAIRGGKNSTDAQWIEEWLIPKFVEQQKAKGRKATVRFQPSGTADEDYKSKVALDLKTGGGADVIGIDGIWVGEFAEAGYIKPLDDVVGAGKVNGWEGWTQIPASVQQNASFDGNRYGVPIGTDGRVIFYNKNLFARAGLPTTWQPKSWDEILQTARTIKARLNRVTPIQLNAGTAMGEATTMQGFLPLLAGTGKEIYTGRRWLGNTPEIRAVLGLYEKIYREKLGDPVLQQDAKGRDKSFQKFAENEIAILLEGDYFWRDVVNPKTGIAKMANRDEVVGYALIPAATPGSGVRGQDFVSMSGGGSNVLNPNTKYPQQAWELLQFMNSAEAIKASLSEGPQITARNDVNAEVLKNDPMLSFVAQQVLPITLFRPGLAVYPRISQSIQQATLDVVSGTNANDAAAAYQQILQGVVGADKVASG